MFELLSYSMTFITKTVGLGLVLDDLSLALGLAAPGLGLYLGLSLSLGLSDEGLQFCHWVHSMGP